MQDNRNLKPIQMRPVLTGNGLKKISIVNPVVSKLRDNFT